MIWVHGNLSSSVSILSGNPVTCFIESTRVCLVGAEGVMDGWVIQAGGPPGVATG